MDREELMKELRFTILVPWPNGQAEHKEVPVHGALGVNAAAFIDQQAARIAELEAERDAAIAAYEKHRPRPDVVLTHREWAAALERIVFEDK